ncbi:MAG TPA: PIN domain-containing protein [Chthonomonadaceae bacterium]|nr:PIN domain-containing protein [Chthonomonadaceae bacterium]
MKIFVDTLFAVALINERDQYHARAVECADLYEGQPLVVTDAVLLEIGNALARRYKLEAVEAIEGFLTAENVEVVRLTQELFERAFALYKAYRDKEWGMVDCISSVVMQEMGITDALTSINISSRLDPAF